MDELTKTRPALYGVIKKIQHIFSFREFSDYVLNELKMHIEYYEELKKQLESALPDEQLTNLFKRSV
ncbi:MAG: hypothetical protein NC485_07545 [Ruminococcus flavefaciens]|nr:hypothetical protein [Ruminococcus flavefaciens]MCM1062374.1 hypothetical protein [Eubacterium sp.]